MILWLDGFDHYTTISQKYAQQQAGYHGISASYARPSQYFEGNGIRIRGGENNFDSYIERGGLRTLTTGTGYNVMLIGVACYLTPSGGLNTWPPTQTIACIQTRDSRNNFIGGVGFKNLQIHAYNWNGSVAINTGYTIEESKWFYLEFALHCHPSNGRIIVRKNNQLLIDQSGIATMSSNPDDKHTGVLNTCRLRGVREDLFSGEGATMWFDDLYVLNGVAPNNDFWGDVSIYPLYPAGTGTFSQWSVTGTAVNWEAIDEAPPNTTDYVYAIASGTTDTYAYEDLPGGITDVYGIQQDLYARQDAGYGRVISPVAYSGTLASGTSAYLSQIWTYHYETHDADPVDSGTWTPTKVNDHEYGVKVEF